MLALLVVLLARIALLYPVLANTMDEPIHIAAGLEFLETGRYTLEPQHPPLARLAVAALPYYLAGLRLGGRMTLWNGGTWDQRDAAYYWRTLSLARAGNLLFAALLFCFVGLWTRLLFGFRPSAVAGAIVSASPNLIAHASLATLDLAAAATVLITAYFFWRWIEQPGWRYCLAAAVAFGVAVLSKFSTLVFLPPLAALYLLLGGWRNWSTRQSLLRAGSFCLLSALVVWAGYGFRVGSVVPRGHRYQVSMAPWQQNSAARQLAGWVENRTLPAPRFWQGLVDVANHNEQGHLAYLCREWSQLGWWYYFPLTLGVKTTLPFLLLSGISIGLVLARRPPAGPRGTIYPLVGAIAVLGVAMAGNLNIGIRHVLAIYPFLAILAGGLFSRAWQIARLRHVAVLLVAWHVVESLAAHPDYLAYFNEIARGKEEQFLADSNLDWGQDLARLARFARENRMGDLQLSYFGSASPGKLGVPHTQLLWDQPRPGWIAVSVNHLLGLGADYKSSRWARERKRDGRVGKSIWLYYLPPR